MRRPARARLAVAILALATAPGCYPQRDHAAPAPKRSSSAYPSASSQRGSCPATYAAADAHRPSVRLRFDLAPDRRHVTGSEHVRFTPDLPVTELVFRLWPNGASAPVGTKLTVTGATASGGGRFTTQSLGARPGTQGTLLSIPLGRTAPAGKSLDADLTFTLDLPPPHFERWGSSGTTAWWASGHPLLAWERSRGWARQPAVQFPAEAAASEAADTDLTVTTPAGMTVLSTGRQSPARHVSGGRLEWHATSPTARDVSVAAGHFTTRVATVDGVRITAGVAADVVGSADELLAQTKRSVHGLGQLIGPFPYPTLTIATLPGLSSGGIEYPGAIQVGPRGWDVVVPHEAAHQYFYGMLGDNQARDPWLDEAFATYAEARVNGTESQYLPALRLPGRVGTSVQSWGANEEGYYATIYAKGAAALLTARQRAGPAAFDRALRCYVRANAWKITTPPDLARALSGLPAALAVLRQAGALT